MTILESISGLCGSGSKSFLSGTMNLFTHFLHRTWPHGFINTALLVLLSAFLQLGHMSWVFLDVESSSVVKFTDTRVFRA